MRIRNTTATNGIDLDRGVCWFPCCANEPTTRLRIGEPQHARLDTCAQHLPLLVSRYARRAPTYELLPARQPKKLLQAVR